MKPALLVIDVQKAFFEYSPETAQSLNSAIEYINAAIALFRKKDLPVICIQNIDAGENVVPGQPGFDIPERMQILPTDVRIHKTYRNSFNKTPLAEILQGLGVDTVIITGFCAEHCILSTCRGADDQDLNAMLLRGAIASGSQENIRFVENINNLISFGALAGVLA